MLQHISRRLVDLRCHGLRTLLVSACLLTWLPAMASAQQTPREFTHTSSELLAEIDLGWNLGNSLDAPGGETAWGNPTVTPAFLQAVAEAGFELVRIPVTWTAHMGPGPQYVIEPSWLERVAEVAGYARDAGLYVIINLHHDGADGFEEVEWLTLNDADGNLTEANNAAVRRGSSRCGRRSPPISPTRGRSCCSSR